MYDEDGFQVDNKLKHFAIGDRDELKYNKDGSLTIYMQHILEKIKSQTGFQAQQKEILESL